MPVIVNSNAIHPFLPSLGTPLAIESARAAMQDIRPLEIAIINLMADKQTTERQLALWLGNTMLQVRLTFATTDGYVRDVQGGRESRNTPSEHIRQFYSGWGEIKDRRFDGLVVTDDLGAMKAVTGTFTLPQAVLKALAAGADQALWSSGAQDTAAIGALLDGLEKALADGRLDPAANDRAVARVLAAKDACS